MFKKLLKLFLSTIIVLLYFSVSKVYAEVDDDWIISGGKDDTKWTWNQVPYFTEEKIAKSDKTIKSDLPIDVFNKLNEYINEGYTIHYRVQFSTKEKDSGDFKVYFSGDGDNLNWYDRGSGKQEWYETYWHGNVNTHTTKDQKVYFSEDKTEISRFSEHNKLKIHFDTGGEGDDDIYFKDVYFQFVIIDEVAPKVTGMDYYSDYRDFEIPQKYYIKSSDNKKLSYNGSNNKVYMVVQFDEQVQLTNNRVTNFIKTNMSLDGKGKGSFVYVDHGGQLPNNVLVFQYTVSYGDYAREADREGLDNKGIFRLSGKKQFLDDLESYGVKDQYGNIVKPTEIDKHDYGPVDMCQIRIDGDPPEISKVEYNVIGDNNKYLNAGDILEMRVKLEQLLDDEMISVNSNGYFPLNNGGKAYLQDRQEGYGKNDWIVYRYTVSEDDENTNTLQHTITENPTEGLERYKAQIFNVAVKMGIRDDYGNVAEMFTTGDDKTMLFPAVSEKGKNIFVDTKAPLVNFNYNNISNYMNEQIVNMKPYETGSMLDTDEFYYIVSKNPNHPTNGSLDNNLGKIRYPYTRKGDNPDTGYSDTSNLENIKINDNLYENTEGYNHYDEKYDPITKTGEYVNVDYIDGTASDVIYNNRREITGKFYIHTYMKDKAGNDSWQTLGPVYVDNTHSNVKLSPIGTNQYVGDIDINFELLEEEHAGFERYQYRWMSPLDLDGDKLNMKDMYTEMTYTYDILRDNSDKWITGNSLDPYNKSHIPVPDYDERQHGASYLLIRAYDKAGNISYIVSEPYYFDKKQPIVTFESLSDGFDNPVDNHKVKVTVNDEHTMLKKFNYYFSNSIVTRDKDDKIWKQLNLELPDLPADYKPNTDYDVDEDKKYDPLKDEEYIKLLTKEAFLETAQWQEEKLSGYVFLHIYAKDICGNEIIAKQEFVLDNNGCPIVKFNYDNAIGNRYKNVIGHIEASDAKGITTLEYKWTQSTDIPESFEVIDISGLDSKKMKVDTKEFNKDGEWYLHVRATDVYGNVTNCTSEKYIISSLSPDISLFHINNEEIYITNNENIAVTLNKLIDDNLEYTYVVYSDKECNTEVKRGTFSTNEEIVSIKLNNTTSEIQDYYFKFYDSLEQVTEASIKIQAVYDNIPPTADLVYSKTDENGIIDGNVIVTLTNISDNCCSGTEISISENTYTFTKNGEHVFTLTDKAGNEKTYVAKVDWIIDDKPIIRLNTNNVYGQQYKHIKLTLTAQRPTDTGYVNIDDPEMYYQFSESQEAVDESDEEWIKYNNGQTVTLDNKNGEYYLNVKLVDGKRIFTHVFGKFILDNLVNEPEITYSYTDNDGKLNELNREDYEKIQEINSPVTVQLSFDEDIIIKSLTDIHDNELTKEKIFTLNKNNTITAKYMDRAGNEGTKEIDVTNINISNVDKPTFTITPNKYTNDKVIVIIEASADKVLGNIRFNDEAVKSESITFTPLKEDEDKNYVKAEFEVNENGTIKVDILDIDGNEVISTEEYIINNIDKENPIGNIKISNIDKYTKTAGIEITDMSETTITKVEFIKEDNTIIDFTSDKEYIQDGLIYNDITHTVTTRINGTVKYYLEDSAGNKSEVEKVIDSVNTQLDISKVTAEYKVDGDDTTYNTIESIGVVNKDVTVTLNLPEEYDIVNNSGKNTRTFVVGIKYDFLISNGINIDKYSIDLTNTIKKTGPVINLNYTIDGENYVNKLLNGKTSKNVLLTITSDDDIKKVEFDGVEDNKAPFSYEFTENKVITIVATDEIGNTSIIKTSVDYIDKEPVRAGLFSLYTSPTKESKIKLQFLATKPVDILEIKKEGSFYNTVENGSEVDKYEFDVDNNGTYSVRYRDDIGNENTVELAVSNFDREAPIVKLIYNGEASKKFTKDNVLVTVQLVNEEQESDGIRVLNTIGNNDSYLFTENGEFTFRVTDAAGNVTDIEAKVDNIDRTPPSYDITYSETKLTKNDVMVTVTIDEDNYKILNKDIDQSNNDNSVNKNVIVNGRNIAVKFDDNGYYQLSISDEAGNMKTVLLRVRNIDRIEPTIEFLNDYVVTLNGEIPDLNDFIAYDTHDGNIDDKVTISDLEVTTEGDKTITYTVSDTAGNIVDVDRIVKVVGDDFAVIVDGQEVSVPFITDNRETDIKIFNLIENSIVKYIKGSGAVKDGEFKQGGQVFDTIYDDVDDGRSGKGELKFSVDKTGWYTIYIQDYNRQTRSITIYFTKTK
ncbi:hypothetical protein [Vallitalea guaymasensis]|uniref:hypothetical protein n=1 Tax=Vallitalea guaymasensis TaxID=1185412 RepID=UPI000DE4747E|nr:hypothetical protein [Vallitalea guaymasensis]